jgi:hypothetical protein
VLPYRDDQPVPPGYRLDGTGGGGLIAAGLLIGGAVYAGGLIAAANSGFSNGTGWLALPIAGPWISIGSRKILGCDKVTDEEAADPDFNPISECKDAARDYASGVGFLTGAGIFQAVGLTLVALGISNREYQLVRYDVAGFELTPKQLGAGGAGLDITKTF